jgi:hypothetical protein
LSRRKDKMTEKDKRNLETAVAAFSRETGIPFTSVDDAEKTVEEFKSKMSEEGRKTVSEANLQRAGIIPAGTSFHHLIDLGHNGGVSVAAAGLFMAAWDHKWKFHPMIGGMAARGCGGLLEGEYSVLRLEDGDWIDDCTVVLRPYEGVSICSRGDSQLIRCTHYWKNSNDSAFKFDFQSLVALVSDKEAA